VPYSHRTSMPQIGSAEPRAIHLSPPKTPDSATTATASPRPPSGSRIFGKPSSRSVACCTRHLLCGPGSTETLMRHTQLAPQAHQHPLADLSSGITSEHSSSSTRTDCSFGAAGELAAVAPPAATGPLAPKDPLAPTGPGGESTRGAQPQAKSTTGSSALIGRNRRGLACAA
jgi:hypothetical protein